MKSFLRVIFLMIFILPFRGGAAISLANLDAEENVVIYDRLQRILKMQYSLWATCPQTLNQPPPEYENLRRWYQLIRATGFERLDLASQKSRIVQLIREIQISKNVPSTCASAQAARQVRSVRKPMPVPVVTNGETARFLKEVAPACFPVASQGELSVREDNACFGGDTMIFQDIQKAKIPFPESATVFANSLIKSLNQTQPHGQIDLLQVYAQAMGEIDTVKLMTLLASFVTSGNSGLTGWLQGVEDLLLVSDLNNASLSAEKIFARSKELQLAKIQYQKFRDVTDRYDVHLNLFGHDVSSWNRHNFMASYMGCRTQGEQEKVARRVHWVGVAYESKDFVSHMLEGVSLQASLENFHVDTFRYLESSRLGWSACH